MAVYVMNHTGTQKIVPIIGPKGQREEIHVQPGGRPELLRDWKIDPTYREKGVELRDTNLIRKAAAASKTK